MHPDSPSEFSPPGPTIIHPKDLKLEDIIKTSIAKARTDIEPILESRGQIENIESRHILPLTDFLETIKPYSDLKAITFLTDNQYVNLLEKVYFPKSRSK